MSANEKLTEAARVYRDNHHWVPLRLRGKSPDSMGKKWQRRTLKDPIPEFDTGDNIGVLLGAPSGDLVRLDPDFQAIDDVTDILFPEPTAISGRKSAERSGRLYICKGLKTTNFKLPQKELKDDQRLPWRDGKASLMVFQILSTGAQTVVPPSIHPDSGEELVWRSSSPPLVLDARELIRRVGIEAFCMAVRQFWPPRGTRNEAAMALARTLLEALSTRYPDEEERIAVVDDLVLAVAMAGGDEEESRKGKERAAATLAKLKAGEHTVGLTRLIELLELPPGVMKTFRKWLGAAPPATYVSHELNWRECRADGNPLPTMHNAKLAINALNITCRHDLFHDKILIGFRGDVQHEVKPIIGELTDNTLMRLRQLVSDRYGFDFEDKPIHDAVKSFALENCFDPVLDMLDAAQGGWDKTPRLDTWVVTYLGCADTELSRTIGRKVLIAACRRARQPGCKFDNITVLESPEGMNKSTAIRVLAGDDNFSDQSLLGARDKEVQEQLCGIWMHENADLAGMRRADVEHVKAFASRQVDRARPAYGRVVENRKRRSIEWGSTNDAEYLLSHNGNRRFWPLATGTIDIEALRRDRLQLLGEAAHCEAQGESLLLDEKLWPDATSEQEKRRSKHPWEEILSDIPDVVTLGDDEKGKRVQIVYREDGSEKVRSSDILTYVLQVPKAQQNPHHGQQLTFAMVRNGWKRSPNKIKINGRQERGYFRNETL